MLCCGWCVESRQAGEHKSVERACAPTSVRGHAHCARFAIDAGARARRVHNVAASGRHWPRQWPHAHTRTGRVEWPLSCDSHLDGRAHVRACRVALLRARLTCARRLAASYWPSCRVLCSGAQCKRAHCASRQVRGTQHSDARSIPSEAAAAAVALGAPTSDVCTHTHTRKSKRAGGATLNSYKSRPSFARARVCLMFACSASSLDTTLLQD